MPKKVIHAELCSPIWTLCVIVLVCNYYNVGFLVVYKMFIDTECPFCLIPCFSVGRLCGLPLCSNSTSPVALSANSSASEGHQVVRTDREGKGSTVMLVAN